MTNPSDTPTLIDRIVEGIAEKGFAVTPDFLPEVEVNQLRHETLSLVQSGAMRRAGIGAQAQLLDEIRGDLVHWLDANNPSAAQQGYLSRLEELRQSANRALFLGLFDFEGHLALYPPGTFYLRHLDQFKGNLRRTLTCILYLNHGWRPQDGGELRLYLENDQHLDILPQGGTLVSFLSGRFWHEVLPTRRERASVTGWFKTRGESAV
jgi:SM-20-related protein